MIFIFQVIKNSDPTTIEPILKNLKKIKLSDPENILLLKLLTKHYSQITFPTELYKFNTILSYFTYSKEKINLMITYYYSRENIKFGASISDTQDFSLTLSELNGGDYVMENIGIHEEIIKIEDQIQSEIDPNYNVTTINTLKTVVELQNPNGQTIKMNLAQYYCYTMGKIKLNYLVDSYKLIHLVKSCISLYDGLLKGIVDLNHYYFQYKYKKSIINREIYNILNYDYLITDICFHIRKKLEDGNIKNDLIIKNVNPNVITEIKNNFDIYNITTFDNNQFYLGRCIQVHFIDLGVQVVNIDTKIKKIIKQIKKHPNYNGLMYNYIFASYLTIYKKIDSENDWVVVDNDWLELDPDKTLFDYHIDSNCVLKLKTISNTFPIFLKTLVGKTYLLHIKSSDLIDKIKLQITKCMKETRYTYQIKYMDKFLLSGTVQDNKIKKEAMIHIVYNTML